MKKSYLILHLLIALVLSTTLVVSADPGDYDLNARTLILDGDGDSSLNVFVDDQLDITLGANIQLRMDVNGHTAFNNTNIESWATNYAVIQLGGSGAFFAEETPSASDDFYMLLNAYWDGAAWRYRQTDEAALLQMQNGRIFFSTKPSGTAGNSFTWDLALEITNANEFNFQTNDLLNLGNAGTDFTSSAVNIAQTTTIGVSGTSDPALIVQGDAQDVILSLIDEQNTTEGRMGFGLGASGLGNQAFIMYVGNANGTSKGLGLLPAELGSGTAKVILGRADANANGMIPTGGVGIFGDSVVDDEHFVIANTDINHGLLSYFPTAKSFYSIRKLSSTLGGVELRYLAENNASATRSLVLNPLGGQPTTTKSSTAFGLVDILIAQHTGADALDNIATNGNIFSIRSRVSGAYTTNWLLDVDGDVWQPGILNLGEATTPSAQDLGLYIKRPTASNDGVITLAAVDYTNSFTGIGLVDADDFLQIGTRWGNNGPAIIGFSGNSGSVGGGTQALILQGYQQVTADVSLVNNPMNGAINIDAVKSSGTTGTTLADNGILLQLSNNNTHVPFAVMAHGTVQIRRNDTYAVNSQNQSLTIYQASTGDGMISFDVGGSGYGIGIDNSASDVFIIGNHNNNLTVRPAIKISNSSTDIDFVNNDLYNVGSASTDITSTNAHFGVKVETTERFVKNWEYENTSASASTSYKIADDIPIDARYEFHEWRIIQDHNNITYHISTAYVQRQSNDTITVYHDEIRDVYGGSLSITDNGDNTYDLDFTTMSLGGHLFANLWREHES